MEGKDPSYTRNKNGLVTCMGFCKHHLTPMQFGGWRVWRGRRLRSRLSGECNTEGNGSNQSKCAFCSRLGYINFKSGTSQSWKFALCFSCCFPCFEQPLTLISHLLGRTGKSLRDGRNPQLIFLSKIATGALGNPFFKAENEASLVGSGEKHCNITRVER